jgi:hypothetical protein
MRLFVIAVVLASCVAARADWSRVADQWDGYNLTEDQKRAMGFAHSARPGPRCCDPADGYPVDAELRRDGWWVPTIDAPGQWTRVPEELYVPGANPVGKPIVWWTPSGGTPRELRCFWPGATG